ncbi:MAG TPA: hypothetical protein VF532_00110 [Candidatus Angelobacter sp.]
MNRICWRLADLLSHALEPAEREAVRGDLVECGESGGQALRDVLGLVVRRQAALLADWHSWVILTGLIVPLGMLLSVISTVTANRTAIYLWMYANNWHWAYLANPGFWYVLAEVGGTIFLWCLTLACAAWTSGFVLGAASRRNIPANSLLLCLMLVFGGLVSVPLYWQYLSSFYQRVLGFPLPSGRDGVVFALAFYRAVFPLIVQATLVLLPAIWGMREGSHMPERRPLFKTVLWTATAMALAAVLFQAPGLVFFLKTLLLKSSVRSGLGNSWEIRLLQLAVYWPVAYIIAIAGSRRWRNRLALS